MKTLADAKRRLTVGTVVEVTNLRHPHLSGRRTIMKAQTNALAMTIPERDDLSWIYWPTAAGLRFDGPDTVTFLERIDPPRPTTYMSPSQHTRWLNANCSWGDPWLTLTVVEGMTDEDEYNRGYAEQTKWLGTARTTSELEQILQARGATAERNPYNQGATDATRDLLRALRVAEEG